MNDGKILDAKWWTPRHLSSFPGMGLTDKEIIGVIAFISYEPAGEWKCYIGYGLENDTEEQSCRRILQRGVPFGDKEAACALFPLLDPEGFRL